MQQIVKALQEWNFNVCSIFILDTSFCLDRDKFISAALTTLSALVALMTPSVNVLTKMDLISKDDHIQIQELLDGDMHQIMEQVIFYSKISNCEIFREK
jgi:50S ribosomal subunit-associated GTPase HflX